LPALTPPGSTSPVTFDTQGTATLGGDLDMMSAPAVQADLLRWVGGGGPLRRIDLSGVEFLDSTGAHALVVLARRLAPHRIEVLGAAHHCRRVFALLGLDDLFDWRLPQPGSPSGTSGL
jgi:anti-anti-sigma factor